MAQPAQVGPQLPPDSNGKITGAFPIVIPGPPTAPGNPVSPAQTVYVPATVIVNADGYEIGQTLIETLRDTNDLLAKALTALALIAGEIAGAAPDELTAEAAI